MKQYWTQQEIDFLIKNHNTMANLSIAIYLNRSVKSVSDKVYRLQLKPKIRNKNIFWTKSEDKFLLDNYLSMTKSAMSIFLKRTPTAIYARARILGITKNKEYIVNIGDKFNRLTVVEKLNEQASDGKYLYLCKCDCGNTTKLAKRYIVSGHTKSCGCLAREVTSSNTIKPKGEASYNYLYGVIKYNAKKRKINFNLSKDEHKNIINQNCFYCGAVPEEFTYYSKNNIKISDNIRKRSFVYINGVDRVDPNKGYTKDNCVPCCKKCNVAKLDLSVNDFLEHIKKIYDFQKQKGNK